jgi:hypothetical protein
MVVVGFRFFRVLLGWLDLELKHLNSMRTGWAAKQRAFEQPLLSLALREVEVSAGEMTLPLP